VEERANGLILITAILEHQGGHRQQVGGVRNSRALSLLALVRLARVDQCRIKPVCQIDVCDRCLPSISSLANDGFLQHVSPLRVSA
jgi:hypothetical protein